jgi:dipeptidyl aminopeptidase/acylaminoacyl peptidase
VTLGTGGPPRAWIASLILGFLAASSVAFAETRIMQPKDLIDLRQVSEPAIAPDGSRIAFVVTARDAKENAYQSDVYLVDAKQGEPLAFTRNEKNDRAPAFSPDGAHLAFISERDEKAQIFLADLRGGEPSKLTEAKGGVSAFAWSADAKWIAFLAADVASEDEEKRIKTKDDERVADAGFKMTHLWRVDLASREVKRLTEGEFTLADPRISPDGSTIAAVRRKTPKADDGATADIVLVPATGGVPRVLYENGGPDTSPRFSPDGAWIAFTSRDGKLPRPGNDSLVVIPSSGGAIRTLTPIDLAPSAPAWSHDGDTIYFSSSVGVEGRLFAVASRGGPPREIARGAFVAGAPQSALKAPLLAYLRQDPKSPNDVYVQRVALGTSEQALKRTTMNPEISDLALSTTERVRWKSADGREIEGLLHRPPDAAGRKLPLAVLVHGGPAGQYGLTFPSSMNNYHHIMTGRGFVVFQPNFRGSSGYGDAFLRLNLNDWGKGDYRDIMTGIDALVARGVADPDKLVLHGWSYGGYMCSWTITQTTRFKAASCGAGLTNLVSMYGTNDIPGTLDDYFGGGPYDPGRAAAYWSASAMAHVSKAKTPTLILHGAVDDRVPPSQGQELYLGLRKLGVPTEFVTYPREPHGFREPNHQLDKVEREITWFERWLGPGR